jgi:hypothetical protein
MRFGQMLVAPNHPCSFHLPRACIVPSLTPASPSLDANVCRKTCGVTPDNLTWLQAIVKAVRIDFKGVPFLPAKTHSPRLVSLSPNFSERGVTMLGLCVSNFECFIVLQGRYSFLHHWLAPGRSGYRPFFVILLIRSWPRLHIL